MNISPPPVGGLAVTQILRPDRGAFSIERVYRDIRAQRPGGVDVRPWTCPHPSRGILSRLRGAWAARRAGNGLYHVTGDAHYLALFLPRARTILTVHDCEFVHRARGIRRALLWLLWLRLPCARACRVVVPTRAVRRDLLALVPLDPARVATIENPVSPAFRPSPARPPGRPVRVLQIGTKENKNIPRLAAALAGLDVTLFIVGQPTAAQHAALAAAGLRYDWAANLSEPELHAAYRDCDILAFCSLSEGFGLPIVEAQSVGRVVVTSNRAPMTEVAGAGAAFADPEDVGDIRRVFRTLLADPARRAALVARGRQNARRFRADRIAAAYVDLYRSVAADAARQGAAV